MIGDTCPRCQTIHSSGSVMALGRFDPSEPLGFRIVGDDDALYSTREAAIEALCAQRAGVGRG